jgi:hypothetical protein
MTFLVRGIIDQNTVDKAACEVATSYQVLPSRMSDTAKRSAEVADRSGPPTNGGESLLCGHLLATIVGMIMNFTPVDPIRALYWSAVINGVVAVPVMAIMMWLATMPKVMGEFAVTGWVKTLGWAATVVMAITVVAMLATS